MSSPTKPCYLKRKFSLVGLHKHGATVSRQEQVYRVQSERSGGHAGLHVKSADSHCELHTVCVVRHSFTPVEQTDCSFIYFSVRRQNDHFHSVWHAQCVSLSLSTNTFHVQVVSQLVRWIKLNCWGHFLRVLSAYKHVWVHAAPMGEGRGAEETRWK